jgi:hypothetical protein
MRDEPKVELKCQSIRSLDTKKDAFSLRQRGCVHGSRNQLKECVTTHTPNENTPKMDGA